VPRGGGADNSPPQSIVVGGESGAGKTEASKMLLAHLVKRSATAQAATQDLDARLLGTNPILEAFGNASTLRNPNSSRFGKLLRLHFDTPVC
jgi:myosin heavy subunit